MKSFKINLASALLVWLHYQQTCFMHKINSVKMTNPLLQKSTLQYQAPPFNLIKDKDFKPAFEYGLQVHNKEVGNANNPAKPSFQNRY
jgi:peptidyl-dipeptidase Dcp